MSPVLESIAWGLVDLTDFDIRVDVPPTPTLDQLGQACIAALQVGDDEWAHLVLIEINEMIRRVQHAMDTQLLEANAAGITRIH
ncbi:hypothetical protein [Roseateles sp.]|uniref:hypothetical protein n=1 Tax=Roseateles sp. TaxID=1971397 RepID=UPI003BAA5ADE